jgi:hypothetical protein
MSEKCHKPTYAVQQTRRYSITSSASASREGGIVRPSALAVFRLMKKSNLFGSTTQNRKYVMRILAVCGVLPPVRNVEDLRGDAQL